MGTHIFDDLPLVLQKHAGQLGRMVSQVAQKAALAGGAYLAEETPVDTGVARSNWVMTLDAPFEGVIPAYMPYPTYRMNHHDPVKQAVVKAPGRARRVGAFHPSVFKGIA